MSKLGSALRKKFKTPAAAIAALGLDEALISRENLTLAMDEIVRNAKENRTMKHSVLTVPTGTILTRKAAAQLGVLTGYLAPRLAADAKIEALPLLTVSVSSKSTRADLVKALMDSTKDCLAKDAKIDAIEPLILALDAMEPEEVEDEEADDLPTVGGKKGDGPGKDKKGKDKKGKDAKPKGFDALPESFKKNMKDNMSEDEFKKACDAMKDCSMDEEDDEVDEDPQDDPPKTATDKNRRAKDKKARDAEPEKDKDKDEEMVSAKDVKKAMDAAIAGERQKNIRRQEALDACTPLVGKLAVACDSAEDVYKTTLTMLGVDVKGVDPSAFPTLLKLAGRPKTSAQPIIAQDSSGATSFNALFPEAAKHHIRQL